MSIVRLLTTEDFLNWYNRERLQLHAEESLAAKKIDGLLAKDSLAASIGERYSLLSPQDKLSITEAITAFRAAHKEEIAALQ